MQNRNRRRPSPATVISLLALVFSMAGTATAARVLITSSSQVKNGTLTSGDIKDAGVSSRDIKDSAVTGAKVKNGSLESDDFSGAARTALQAAETQALEVFRKVGPDAQPAGTDFKRVATLDNVPAGTYAISSKTVLTPIEAQGGFFGQGSTLTGRCELDAGGDKDQSVAFLGSPGAIAPSIVHNQITRSFGGSGTITLSCAVDKATFRASDTSIIAVRVGRAPRSPVEG
jgi:hypothetical protein